MPEESFIEFTVDRIIASQQSSSDLPELLTRKRPAPIAISFPDPDSIEYLATLARPEIMMGSLSQAYTMADRHGVIVSLLYSGLLRKVTSRTWRIIHPAHYGLSIEVPIRADLFVFGKNPPPEIALNYLQMQLQSYPPSALTRP